MLNSSLISAQTVLTDWTENSIPKTNQSLEDEAGLYKVSSTTNSNLNTVDDTGKESYVYRGAVTNNFVQFNNMCWRAVRIDGDSNTKLVLYNLNSDNVSNPCNVSGDKLAFIGTGSFSSGSDPNAYVGWMYGTPNSSSFAEEHAHINESNALKALKTWYNTNFVNKNDGQYKYQDYLADVVWCNDVSTTGLGYGSNVTSYGYTNRSNPTLRCENELSVYTSTDYAKTNVAEGAVYKMGLLTADEFAFAGLNSSCNSSYYLYANAYGSTTWTMSPGGYISNYYVALEWRVGSCGYLYNSGHVNDNVASSYNLGYRPAVSLKASTTVSLSGTGTAENPYVVTGF